MNQPSVCFFARSALPNQQYENIGGRDVCDQGVQCAHGHALAKNEARLCGQFQDWIGLRLHERETASPHLSRHTFVLQPACVGVQVGHQASSATTAELSTV